MWQDNRIEQSVSHLFGSMLEAYDLIDDVLIGRECVFEEASRIGIPVYVCSYCGYHTEDWHSSRPYKYCPLCGAKIRDDN